MIGNNITLSKEFKEEMMEVFEMTDLGEMTYFLGMEIKKTRNEVFICQKKYIKEILKRFRMEECKSVSTPMNQKEKLKQDDGAELVDEEAYRSLTGCLMYLTTTRPNILFPVSVLSRFLNCASELHMIAAKRVVRYVIGTLAYGIKFGKSQNFKLFGYCDSDWGGSTGDMKSNSCYCFTFGSGCFSWCSMKQETVAQLTAEA
ncbi:secreted RxLR effector protein 161-like [Capsicum annuum]|uniref:secreted RxLR effector protein 161-like n=1 Tax=Capsicum annuum TaxID=4072 RepID=UPI001FB12178|nr:secreted RxLR effector protein 161-like [Capsicum annuum]